MIYQPFFIPACLFFVLALPLVFQLIPPNRLYGIRTPKALSNEKIWFKANKVGGYSVIISSLIYFLVSYLYPTAGSHSSDFSLWLIHLLAFALPLAAGLSLTLEYIKKL